jgi:aspartate/methionine/tyrosine aminotransferase
VTTTGSGRFPLADASVFRNVRGWPSWAVIVLALALTLAGTAVDGFTTGVLAWGLRLGFYAGDPGLVRYLQEVRKHVGMMVPGPAQAAGVAALDDDAHVEIQRQRYRSRLGLLADVLADWSGAPVPLPAGAFYLWIPADDGWGYTERLARLGGTLVSPGEFYGDDGQSFVRVAVVQPDDRIELVADRLRSVG